jgi:hypothetical protein
MPRMCLQKVPLYFVCVSLVTLRVILRAIESFFLGVGGGGLDKIRVPFNYHYGLSEKHTEY